MRIRALVLAVAAVALAGLGSAAAPRHEGVVLAGQVKDCSVPQDPGAGSTSTPAVSGIAVSTSGNDVRYRSGTTYATVNSSGVHANRYGTTAGEPTESARAQVTPSAVCAASPAAGAGYHQPIEVPSPY